MYCATDDAHSRARVRSIAKSCQDSPTKELRTRRTKLTERISKFRKDQKRFMRLITPLLASEPFAEAENEKLFLPSDFSLAQRSELCLDALAMKQVKFLDVALGEVVTSLQTVVKTISTAFERKIKHARGQEQNTRSNTKIRTIMAKRLDLILDYHILDYQTLRDALVSLDVLDEEKWPKLEEKDTFRKSTEKRRRPGDPPRLPLPH